MQVLVSVNVVVNKFFRLIQSLSSIPIVEWLLRCLALSQAILPTGWPENYDVKDGDVFDFIVVGSGSAGAIVAARLSEVPEFNVILIEAGGDPPVTSVIPGLFPLLQNTEYDWNYRAILDEGVGLVHPGLSLPYARGKVLGGCSSTNYLIYARGVPEDYDEWARIAPGWNWDTALYYFKKLEGMTDTTLFQYQENAYLHSPNGPVKVSRPVTFTSTTTIDNIRLNSYEELGIKRVLEANGPQIFGATRPHLTIYNGRRSSTAEVYLRPVIHRPNLKVAKYATVTRVLIDPLTMMAYGVEIAKPDKILIKVYSKKEVIISAGVINSPKILLQSGIGPADELKKLNIDVLSDLPVGKNFHDHQILMLPVKGRSGLDSAAENILVASRLDTVPIPLQSGLFRLNNTFFSYPNKLQPHFQFFNTYVGAGTTPVLFVGCQTIANFNFPYCATMSKANAFNEMDLIILVLLHPLSRGQVSLRSKNKFDDPIIQLGYYRNEYDLFVATEGLKYMSSLVRTSYFREVQGIIAKLSVTGCDNLKWGSDEYWRCYAKNSVTSIQHGVGTCSMGDDGVVNQELKVHNVHGLRVVDASVIPLIPSGNTNAPTMMIGERASDLIKNSHGFLNVHLKYF